VVVVATAAHDARRSGLFLFLDRRAMLGMLAITALVLVVTLGRAARLFLLAVIRSRSSSRRCSDRSRCSGARRFGSNRSGSGGRRSFSGLASGIRLTTGLFHGGALTGFFLGLQARGFFSSALFFQLALAFGLELRGITLDVGFLLADLDADGL